MTSENRDTDRGFTLVELLIASILMVLVLTLVGGVLIQGLRIQNTVQASTTAATTSQLASQSLSRGIHNSLRLQVSTPAAGISLLQAVVRSDDSTKPAGTLVCQAWVITGGEFRTTRSGSAIAAPTSASAVTNWTLLASGVASVDSATPVFIDVGATSVDIAFTVDAPDSSPVLVDRRIAAFQPDANPGLTCF